MWKDFIALAQTVLTLAKDLERMREEIRELRQTVLQHTLVLQRLSDQMEMNRQSEKDAREKMALQLQVELLRFEKQLPPTSTSKE